MANKRQKATVNLPVDLRIGVEKGLLKHGKVKVVGLGIFETRRIPSRPGRNPKDGSIMQMPKYNKIKFRPTKQLKEAIN